MVGGVGSAVALRWSLRYAGRMQGLVDDGIAGGCASLVECRIQECSGEDRRSRQQRGVPQETALLPVLWTVLPRGASPGRRGVG